MTTPDAVRSIADAASVDPRDVGYAGLKDKHAVTTQWLSLPIRAIPPERWQLPEQIEVLEVSAHANKLRTGHLRGNHFSIALLGVGHDAGARALKLASFLRTHGMFNSFGAQRFGRDGNNLSLALAWLQGDAKKRLTRFLLKLYPSVVQSEVFNRYLGLRRAEGLTRLLPGEWVRLNGSGATFLVEDAERELPRLESREIHLTGPMLGPKMRTSGQRPRELEERAKLEAGVDQRIEATLARLAPGTRRDLLVFPEGLELVEQVPDRIRLEFDLPAGSYATVLAREFTRSPWLQADPHFSESIDS